MDDSGGGSALKSGDFSLGMSLDWEAASWEFQVRFFAIPFASPPRSPHPSFERERRVFRTLPARNSERGSFFLGLGSTVSRRVPSAPP